MESTMMSFARTLMRQSWAGRYSVHGSPAHADCVVGFAFGRLMEQGQVLPGNSNEELAKFAERYFPNLPKILQLEIAKAQAYLRPGDPDMLEVVKEHRQEKRYLDTREMALQAWEIMQRRSWRSPIVLAHSHHMPRADAVCRKIGMHTVCVPGLDQINFCQGSAQIWTRRRFLWFPREVAAILHYWWKGWI
jgi:hypothetical protein